MKKYLVAQYNGSSKLNKKEFHYSNYDIIEAESKREAEEKYNKKHNCNYFSSRCIGEYNEKTGKVEISLEYFIQR